MAKHVSRPLGSGVQGRWRKCFDTQTQEVADYVTRLEANVRDRGQDPKIMVAEHCCPSCAGLLHVDVYPDGFEGFPAPQLNVGKLAPLELSVQSQA